MSCVKVTHTKLTKNSLRGVIPDIVSLASNLGELYMLLRYTIDINSALNYNYLSGTIPSQLGSLRKLFLLYVDSN